MKRLLALLCSYVLISAPADVAFAQTRINVGTLNNTCFADQQAGADMGLKIVTCEGLLPSTGGVIDATGFQGAQTWSTNIFATLSKPALIKVCGSQISVNVSQTPGTPNIRLIGCAGPMGSAGTANTSLIKNFATGDLFAPNVSGQAFELAGFKVSAGVTLTSGFVVNAAPGAHYGYVHDLALQDQYGVFKLFAGSGLPLNLWRIERLSWNCSSSLLHTAQFLWTGSTDNTVTMGGSIFNNWISTGDLCTHDTAPILLDSMTDTPAFNNINFSISRTNTSTQPNWLFQNTLSGGQAPRGVSLVNVYSEGNGLAGNDILQIKACTYCTFTNGDYSGGDHGVNISGGFGIGFFGGFIANNNNGGLYNTTAVANLGLQVNGVNFFGNSVTTTNTFDDIQIADGSSNVSLFGNMFGQVTSTVTANLTRWPINMLGTTSSQISIHGNQSKASKYGNVGLVRTFSDYQGETEMDDGGTLVKRGTSNSSRIILYGGAANLCWQLGVQVNVSNSVEFTPSNAACAGAIPTFNNPRFILDTNGPRVPANFPMQFTEGTTPGGIATESIMWGDATDHFLKYNPNNQGEQHVPQMLILTSAYTNATTTFSTVAGGQTFSFPVKANTNYTLDCHFYYQAAATGGLNIQLTGPASPTQIRYAINAPLSATTNSSATASAFATSLGAVVTTATTDFDATVTAGIVNGVNAGTVTVQAKSSAAVNLTIQPGSYCSIQ